MLNIIPGEKNAGLRSTVNGTRATTWGGGAVYDPISKKWHMIAAEIRESCGMNVWLSNSQIVHATSDTVDGQYVRQRAVENTGLYFSHEPNIVIARDTGEIAVYFTHIYPPSTNHYPCTACKNGETVDCDTDTRYGPNGKPLPSKMIYTNNISDPNAWSEIVDLTNTSPNIYVDSNLATYIFPNGSLIGILRNDNDNTALCYNLVKATHWKQNTSYSHHPMHPYDNNSGKEVAQYGEDPFVWYDPRYDVIHTLWHYTYTGNDYPLGLHAFSQDGGTTFHAYLDFSDDDKDYPAEWAYNATAYYTDGTSESFDTAERPHLIFGDDGYTPLALTNGARPPNNGDYSITILRPINQN